jgi:trimethylamine--corrinoid protein Co-methyltransferase
MTLASMSVLSRDDIGRMHDASLRILSEVGVRMESASVRDLLRDAGADVDDSRQLVRLGERLVRSSVESAPKSIRMSSRGGVDFTIPGEDVQLISTDGQPPAVFDAATATKRASTLSDLRDFIILADALPEVDFVWPPVVATDMPTDRSSFYEFLTAIAYTSKHVQHGAASSEEAMFQIDLCSAILGSEDELRARPIFSDVCTPISPLRYDAGEAEALVTLSKAGIPVVNLSMAIAGAVTPASVAGSLAVINAENLCGLTMTQLASPGSPSIYSSFSGVMDLKSGVFLCGTPEGVLMDSAAVQMAKHYGLPTCAGGPSNAARSLSSEAGLETALTAASALLMGTDMMVGLGGLDRAGMMSKEKLVMDCEVWRWLRRLRRGIDITDETLGLDAIARQGPGGTFLSDIHTARCMRKELMIPQVTAYHVKREPDRTEDELVAFAIERTKELLSTHKPPLLDADAAKKVGEVARRYGILLQDGSQIFEHS